MTVSDAFGDADHRVGLAYRTRAMRVLLLLCLACGGPTASREPAIAQAEPTPQAPNFESVAAADEAPAVPEGEAEEPSSEASPTAPAGEEPEAPTGRAAYAVHEWGLLRGVAGDVLEAGAVGPSSTPALMNVDKPILYFHAASPVDLREVVVDARDGELREHWPLVVDATRSRVRWRNRRLEGRVGLGYCDRPRFPTREQPPCSSLPRGEVCESAELAPLRATTTCVGDAPFLFYRSRTRSFSPPLHATREVDQIRVTHRGDEPIPGRVIRISRRGRYVYAFGVSPPAPGATITIGADPVDSRDRALDGLVDPSPAHAGREALQASLDTLGLTPSERAAFLRAWDAALFGDVHTVGGLPPPRHSILYFLPPGACDQVATLHFDPTPTEVRRTLAVWLRVD